MCVFSIVQSIKNDHCFYGWTHRHWTTGLCNKLWTGWKIENKNYLEMETKKVGINKNQIPGAEQKRCIWSKGYSTVRKRNGRVALWNETFVKYKLLFLYYAYCSHTHPQSETFTLFSFCTFPWYLEHTTLGISSAIEKTTFRKLPRRGTHVFQNFSKDVEDCMRVFSSGLLSFYAFKTLKSCSFVNLLCCIFMNLGIV